MITNYTPKSLKHFYVFFNHVRKKKCRTNQQKKEKQNYVQILN